MDLYGVGAQSVKPHLTSIGQVGPSIQVLIADLGQRSVPERGDLDVQVGADSVARHVNFTYSHVVTGIVVVAAVVLRLSCEFVVPILYRCNCVPYLWLSQPGNEKGRQVCD